MTDHYAQAERMLRESPVSADAAAIVHAILALIDAHLWTEGYDHDEYRPDPDYRPTYAVKQPNEAYL